MSVKAVCNKTRLVLQAHGAGSICQYSINVSNGFVKGHVEFLNYLSVSFSQMNANLRRAAFDFSARSFLSISFISSSSSSPASIAFW